MSTHRFPSLLRLLTLGLMVLAIGCGQSEAARLVPPTLHEENRVGEFLTAKARAFCVLRMRCPSEKLYASVEACMNRHPRVVRVPGSGTGEVPWEAERLVARGDLEFDEEAAEACLSAMSDAHCTTRGYVLPDDRGERACESVFTLPRSMDPEAPCEYDLECEPGYFCGNGRRECGGGTCQPYALGTCRSSRDCPDRTSGRSICQGGHCEVVEEVVQRGKGEPCGPDDDGEAHDFGYCARGLTCAPRQDGGRMQCVRLPNPGDPCDRSVPWCANEAACAGASEGVLGRCRDAETIAERVSEGEPCSQLICDATRDLICVGGTCIQWTGHAGSPCLRGGYPCDAGLHCGRNMRCEAAATPIGGRCHFNDECVDGCCERFRCAQP